MRLLFRGEGLPLFGVGGVGGFELVVDFLYDLLLLSGAAGVAAVATDLRRGDGSNADDGLECIGIVCLVDSLRVACELAQNIVVSVVADGDGNADGVLEPVVLVERRHTVVEIIGRSTIGEQDNHRCITA